ncbi:MAG: class I SAM-dependent methyltransferase [Campylobacterales bacterium]|nr:class I SAM-dependent methyltransferase [Campylobacterales bacterium]
MSENKTRFDAAASEWDKSQTRINMATKITSQIIKNIPLRSDDTVMDFGCGTGLVGLNIAPLVHKLIGADLSGEMLKNFKSKAEKDGLSNVETLELSADSHLGENTYDAIVSAMTLHHIEKPNELFGRFANAIKSGGYLGVADLAKEDGTFHENNTGVYHFGFTPEEFASFFVQNGFEQPQITLAHTIDKAHKSFDILFCYAKKI